MNSAKSIFIQTALRPMAVVTGKKDKFEVKLIADFDEFFTAMNELTIDKDTTIYVNRGPGSYSGIRTGIAYVFGLLHGGLITKEQIKTFTSFDFIRAFTSAKGNIYLKSWPRILTGKLEGSKGYYEDKDKKQSYKSYEEISSKNDLLSVGEEQLNDASEGLYEITSTLINSQTAYQALTEAELETNLEPLYINPVHIT